MTINEQGEVRRLVEAAKMLRSSGRRYEAQLCLQQAELSEPSGQISEGLSELIELNENLLGSMVPAELAAMTDPAVADQAFLKGYQAFHESLRSDYLNYPRQIHLETTATCNASCNFCPYPGMERRGTRMPDELIYKILNELKAIPAHIPFQICPFKVNEPFLDARIFDVLEFVQANLPNASLVITTNASPLNGKNIERLKRFPAISYLLISFADYREHEYEKAMQIPFGRTLARLDEIHAAVEAVQLPFPVCLIRVGDGTEHDDEYRNWAAGRFPRFSVQIYRRQNWIGQINVAYNQALQHVACHHWFEMSITATGIVAHCCMDGEAKWPVGDVTKMHVLDVYNASPLRALREKAIIRTIVEPCAGCALTAR